MALQEFLKRTTGKYAAQDDTIRSWLQAFVNRVGRERAWKLTIGLRNWAIVDDEKASKKVGEAHQEQH